MKYCKAIYTMPRTTRTIPVARLSVLGCALSANTDASDKTTDKANQHTAYYRLNRALFYRSFFHASLCCHNGTHDEFNSEQKCHKHRKLPIAADVARLVHRIVLIQKPTLNHIIHFVFVNGKESFSVFCTMKFHCKVNVFLFFRI